MKNRLFPLALVLALSLGLCAPAFATNTQSFSDVSADHWACSYIERAYQDGAVNGVGGGRYAPDSTLTMAQFLVLMTRVFFPDELAAAADQSTWYSAAVEIAAAERLGLLCETDYYYKGEQGPSYLHKPLSRFDMAGILCNIFYQLEPDLYNDYEDESRYYELMSHQQIPDFYSMAEQYRARVYIVVKAGIINGVDSQGTFSGDSFVNRAQAATIYCRFADFLANAEQEPEQTPTQEDTISAYIAEVVTLVNQERAKEGLAPLSGDNAALNAAAALRANEITTLFLHTRPDGSRCFTAMQETGVSYRTAGENIASGYENPANVMAGWMNSPGHRANILNTDYTQIGVCCAYDESGRLYWVQMFAG